MIFFYSFHKKEAQLAQKNKKYIECMCVAFSALIRMFYEPIPMNMNIKMEIMYKCTHVAIAFKAQKMKWKEIIETENIQRVCTKRHIDIWRKEHDFLF